MRVILHIKELVDIIDSCLDISLSLMSWCSSWLGSFTVAGFIRSIEMPAIVLLIRFHSHSSHAQVEVKPTTSKLFWGQQTFQTMSHWSWHSKWYSGWHSGSGWHLETQESGWHSNCQVEEIILSPRVLARAWNLISWWLRPNLLNMIDLTCSWFSLSSLSGHTSSNRRSQIYFVLLLLSGLFMWNTIRL